MNQEIWIWIEAWMREVRKRSSGSRERNTKSNRLSPLVPLYMEGKRFEFPASSLSHQAMSHSTYDTWPRWDNHLEPLTCQTSLHLPPRRDDQHLASIHWGSTPAVAAFEKVVDKMAQQNHPYAPSYWPGLGSIPAIQGRRQK